MRQNRDGAPRVLAGVRESAGGETLALLSLRLLPGIGDRRIARLIRHHGSASRVLGLPSDHLREALGAKADQALRAPDLAGRVQAIVDQCEQLQVRCVAMGAPAYPSGLHALVDPPPILFIRGRRPFENERAVAVVGARKATPAGRRMAERLGGELSDAGVTVVSGLALGIDGAAHRGALHGRGGTVAVLGVGPDRAYPAGNRRLFEQILSTGAVVSEFPPGEPARPFHFPRRNRLIAALSRAVVVVEARSRSGALITVDHALDLGLEVFAVPGSVESRASDGTNALIRDGAHLLTSAADLLETMGWDRFPAGRLPAEELARSGTSPIGPAGEGPPGAESRSTPQGGPGDGDVHLVASALGSAPRPVDHLVDELALPESRVLAALTRLELRGAAARGGDGWHRASPCAR